MATVLLFVSEHYLIRILALLAVSSAQAAVASHEKHPSCQQFTQGLSFNDTQAYGTWHLLHFKTETDKGSGDSHCVHFTTVSDKERKNLKELLGKFVENLDWQKLTLKMQIPCTSIKTNKTRDYFLERLEGDGSYRTLQVPTTPAKVDLADLHRYPMRLKIVEGEYLGMMDCHEKFVFLLGKQPPEGKPVDDRLKKMIETYWPEEHQIE